MGQTAQHAIHATDARAQARGSCLLIDALLQ
jgi:hypothetical protein